MGCYLLDTNALNSLYDPKLQRIAPRFHAAVCERVQRDGEMAVAAFAFFEALRGLEELRLHGRGQHKLARFNQLIQNGSILGLDRERGWLKAAEFWAETRACGVNLEAGDLVVTATALFYQRKLVTADQALIHALHRLGLGHVVDAHALE